MAPSVRRRAPDAWRRAPDAGGPAPGENDKLYADRSIGLYADSSASEAIRDGECV